MTLSFLPEASLDIQGTLISDGTDGSISFDLNGSNILVSGEAAFVNTSFTGSLLHTKVRTVPARFMRAVFQMLLLSLTKALSLM